MNKVHLITAMMMSVLLALLMPLGNAAKPDNAAKPAVSQTSLREVEYTKLESKIGRQLVIQTTYNTTRQGKLLRYTKVGLIVKLGPENGAIELTVPRETIRKVMTEIGPADPLFPNETSPHEGKPGAKKN